MVTARMHADEVDTGPAVARHLVRTQFPRWADLPLRPVDSFGTDHAIYRLGDALSVRLPRIARATAQAATEARWLPRLAPWLPLAVPRPVAMGHPSDDDRHPYPFDWSIQRWLPGTSSVAGLADPVAVAVAAQLAAFVRALQAIETTGAHRRPVGGRGGPLAEGDRQVRRSLEALHGTVDTEAAAAVWDDALDAPAHTGPGVWVHGDLLPGNLLLAGRRLSAVIDFGGLNVGDPACDLQPAWNSFTGASRRRFLDELGVGHDALRRGRGWVVYQTVSAIAYYRLTNPRIVRQAEHGLAQVLADAGR